jgi:branched-chain amino acid transport system permease protein
VSGTVLMMIILGGIGRLHGAVLGAFAFSPQEFPSQAIFGEFAKHWHLGVGASIILCVALLPRGLTGFELRRLKGGNADERR